MTPFTIREVTEDDAEKLLAYLAKLAEEPDISLPLTPGAVTLSLDPELEYLRNHIEPENSTYLVAEAKGEIIGVFSSTGENFPMTCKLTLSDEDIPDWTTFLVPRREIGIEAVRLLVHMLAHPDEPGPHRKMLACTFVPGYTVGAPKVGN